VRVLVAGIHVNDGPKAYDFYTQVLGWRDALVVHSEQLYILGPSTGWEMGCQINLEPITDEITRRFQEHQFREGLTALMLAVHDVEAEYERLRARGDIVFRLELTHDAIGKHFQIEDTVGNVLSIHQS
jgi:predicted enzyme related to lactoylglutathione lyase